MTDVTTTDVNAPIELKILTGGWVDARALHMTLLVGRDFSNWIKDRLSDFEKGTDWVLAKTGEPDITGKTEKIDYHLTMDTAKAICMLERNPRGKAVRKYFIDCEKELNRPRTQAEMNLAMATAAVELEGQIKSIKAHQIDSDLKVVLLQDSRGVGTEPEAIKTLQNAIKQCAKRNGGYQQCGKVRNRLKFEFGISSKVTVESGLKMKDLEEAVKLLETVHVRNEAS